MGVEGNAARRPGGIAAFGNRSGSLRRHSVLAVAGPHCPGELRPTVERSLLHVVDLVMAAQTQIAGWPVAAAVKPAACIERDALRVAKSPGEHLASAAVGMQSQDFSAQVARAGGPRRDIALAVRRIEEPIRSQLEATAEVITGAARDAVQQHLLIHQRIARDRETRNWIRVTARTCVGVIEEDVGLFDGNSQEPALSRWR